MWGRGSFVIGREVHPRSVEARQMAQLDAVQPRADNNVCV